MAGTVHHRHGAIKMHRWCDLWGMQVKEKDPADVNVEAVVNDRLHRTENNREALWTFIYKVTTVVMKRH